MFFLCFVRCLVVRFLNLFVLFLCFVMLFLHLFVFFLMLLFWCLVLFLGLMRLGSFRVRLLHLMVFRVLGWRLGMDFHFRLVMLMVRLFVFFKMSDFMMSGFLHLVFFDLMVFDR
jgi:hypothetical protein